MTATPTGVTAPQEALGWIGKAGNRAAGALAAALADSSQPLHVREEAAESLGYLRSPGTLPTLIAAPSAPEVQIRFWSVFSLGKFLCPDYKTIDPNVVAALEKMYSDEAIAPGQNYWSVGREALAMLGCPANPGYARRLKEEIDRVRNDPNASEEDRSWAEFYG
jgi:HEAT repeat protein